MLSHNYNLCTYTNNFAFFALSSTSHLLVAILYIYLSFSLRLWHNSQGLLGEEIEHRTHNRQDS